MLVLDMVAVGLGFLGPLMTQINSDRKAAEDGIARSCATFDAPVLTAALPPVATTSSVHVAVLSSPGIEVVAGPYTPTDCVFQDQCDATITNTLSWRTRLSFGLLASVGFIARPDAAHTALQRMFYQDTDETSNTPEPELRGLPDSASSRALIMPSSIEGNGIAVPSNGGEVTLTITSFISSATRTPTLITGNPGTVTHIMDFEADATPIAPEFRTARRSKSHSITRSESYEDSETSPKMEYWPGYLDILTPSPYLGALYALSFAALFLAVGLALLYSLRAPTHPEMMQALELERTARKHAEKQLRLEDQARKKAEAKLALLDEDRQHGSSRSHEVETLKADLKAAETASSDRWAALQKCWLQIEELKQQVDLNEVFYKSKMRSKDAELKGLLKKISQSEVESTTPLEDHTTRQESTERDAVAAGENGNDESANIRTTRPPSPQTTSDSLHDKESNEDSTAKQAAAPGAYGDDEIAPQSEPLLIDNNNDDIISNDAPAPGVIGGNESGTDRSTVPPLAAVPSASGPTASHFPAAKLQSQVKQRQKQKQTSSPLRPNSAKTGIRKKALEKPAKKQVRRVHISLLQQYNEQPVPNASAVGGYGGGEMPMAEPEPEHLPPPPQHDEQPLPMAAAPGPRGNIEIELPVEQVVGDMAVDDEPVVAAEEQPVEMELDGKGGEQMEGDGEAGEHMEVDGADGPAADQQDGNGRNPDAEAPVAHQRQNNVQPPVRLAQLSFAQQGKQERVDGADRPAAEQQDGNGRNSDAKAPVAHQKQNNVQPPVRLAQLSFFQQGKQVRMERSRKAIAQARDSLMAAKEEKEVNGSKWSNVETIRYDATLAKLRMDFNNKKDGFKFAYGEDA
ncbi:hypothetical protein LTR17_021305 [Elasticomyces elasticus]|nr:hypothetical protein LTR17_021305 [Elasticomyces elasticus]